MIYVEYPIFVFFVLLFHMVNMPCKNIVLIGAGRLATQLGLAFADKGMLISQIYNRNSERGKALAKKINATYISALSEIHTDADLYILCISDNAISEVAAGIRLPGKCVVHTSGSVSMDVLCSVSSRRGVFYPLQTFSHFYQADFQDIPVCVEANHKKDEKVLLEIGKMISNRVYPIHEEERRVLHLAAVFANNFTNFMYTLAGALLQERKIPIELLRPLIRQTALNAEYENPFLHQSGPAVRDDHKVIQQHLDMLDDYPAYREIYKLISQNIIQFKKKDGKL